MSYDDMSAMNYLSHDDNITGCDLHMRSTYVQWLGGAHSRTVESIVDADTIDEQLRVVARLRYRRCRNCGRWTADLECEVVSRVRLSQLQGKCLKVNKRCINLEHIMLCQQNTFVEELQLVTVTWWACRQMDVVGGFVFCSARRSSHILTTSSLCTFFRVNSRYDRLS